MVDSLNEHITTLAELKNRAAFLQRTLVEEFSVQAKKTLEYKLTMATIPKIEKQIVASRALRDSPVCKSDAA